MGEIVLITPGIIGIILWIIHIITKKGPLV